MAWYSQLAQAGIEMKIPERESGKDEGDNKRVLCMKLKLLGDDFHPLILGPTQSYYEDYQQNYLQDKVYTSSCK